MKYNKGFEDVITFLTPQVEEFANFKIPSVESLEEWNDFKNRKIYLDFEIGDYLITISKRIISWNSEDKDIPKNERKPITIYINSPGGSLQSCMTFIDVLKMSITPINLICINGAYSAAGMIFMCKGENIVRSIVPHGKVLIHQGSLGMGQVQTHQFLDLASDVQKDEKKVKDYILENTKITSRMYDKKKKDEWTLNAEECILYGVCDKIIEDISELF